MAERDQFNRDEDLKPGSPPRSATEPKGSEGSARTPKTTTDPASGEPNPNSRPPNRSAAEER